jgi:hypothetical protein
MIKGQYTALRAITENDLEQLLTWRNKPEFRQYFREYRELSVEQQKQWYENLVVGSDNTRMFAIISANDGELLGACGLCYIDWVNRNADFSIYIGYDDLYIDDRFAVDAAKQLLKYGFEELNLHRVWAEIYSIDEKKQQFLDLLGFSIDGRHRETHWTHGKWCDSIFYALLDYEYKP